MEFSFFAPDINTQPSMENQITLKITYDKDLRRLTIAASQTLEQVRDLASRMFSLPRASISFCYTDEEGDKITCSCELDWEEAKRQATPLASGGHLLRLEVRVGKPDGAMFSSTTPLQSSACSTPPRAEKPSVDNSNLISQILSLATSNLAQSNQPVHLNEQQIMTALTAVQNSGLLSSIISDIALQLSPPVNTQSNAVLPSPQNAQTTPIKAEQPRTGVLIDVQESEKETVKKPPTPVLIKSVSVPEPQKERVYTAIFLQDVTIPDFTQVSPNKKLIKTWRMKNDGEHSWPQNTLLVRVGGDSIGPETITVPLAAAGETIDLNMEFTTPSKPGRYVTYYRLMAPEINLRFGHRIWIDIQVLPELFQQEISPLQVAAAIQKVDNIVASAPSPVPAPAPDAPASPSPATPPVDSFHVPRKYMQNMCILESMGFLDKALNLDMLIQNKNDIDNTILALCDMQ